MSAPNSVLAVNNMTILRSLFSLISLILLLNILTGTLLYRQFSSMQQSLERDKILGGLIQNESRLQILASNYLHTQSEQYYLQYHEVLKAMLLQVEQAEEVFQKSSIQQSFQLIKNKIVQSRLIMDKYKKNRRQWQIFQQQKQQKELLLAKQLDMQLHSQVLIFYQDVVVQTLKLRSLDEKNAYRQARKNIITLYILLLISFLIVSFFSYIVFRRVSSRIESISSAAKKLGEGDLSIRMQSDASDDMNYLVLAFNYMASRLEKVEQKNTQMLRDAEQQAHHDSLTGLPNRSYLAEKMEHELSRTIRHELKGAVIFIDLDNFKALNDSKGHSAGDLLLIEAAKRMSGQIRSEDTLARMGGDEFVLLLPDLGNSSHLAASRAEHIAEKIKESLHTPYHLPGYEFSITASLGISIFPDDGRSSEELLSHSDIAMYQSKRKGRNCITFYSESMQQLMDSQLQLDSLLSKAIKNSLLETWYQVKVDQQGNVVGAEVLARWHDSEKGWISPDQFIPIAENNGLIIELGKWLIKHVCTTIERWYRLGQCQQLKYLSINVSPKQFYEIGFIELLLEMGRHFRKNGIQLIIEITEGVLLNNSDEVIQSMALLKEHDIDISIDDFGTGFSSMAYLKRLALSEIKIDRSFVSNIHDDKDNQVIVETILSMAEHFGMVVVAEGVETEAELNFLKSRGCQLYQGYYYSKPLPEEELLAFLQD